MKNIAIAAAAVLLVAGPVTAQNTTLRANFGSINLSSGFTPDPYQVTIQAGGSRAAGNTASGCLGNVSDAPDFEVTYTSGSLPLIFRTQSGVDTTLMVNGPDGRWYCDDDGSDGVNAMVVFEKPSSGTYDVWVGTYNGGVNPATLTISELR
jgi:hypothetical protein